MKPKAWLAEGPNVDIGFVAEHRTSGDGARKMRRLFDKHGYKTLVGEANATAKGARSAGTMIFARHNLGVSAFVQDEDADWSKQASARMVLGTLRLKRLEVSLASVYGHTGEEGSGQKLGFLDALVAKLQAGGRRFIAAGGWNMEPAALADTSFREKMDAVVLTDPGIVQTCTSGKHGRVLDYFVVSRELAPAFGRLGIAASPWGPHAAVVVGLSKQPCAIEKLTHIRPRELPAPSEKGIDMPWNQAQELAARLLPKKLVPPELRQHLDRLQEAGKDAIALETEWVLWILPLEIQACAKGGITDPQQMKAHLGRGMVPKLEMRPIVPRHDPKEKEASPWLQLLDLEEQLFSFAPSRKLVHKEMA